MRTLLVALVTVFLGCKEYTPAPLSPIPSEAGKKQCMSGADCASGSCSSDGRCR
jgi:hypothetical protein